MAPTKDGYTRHRMPLTYNFSMDTADGRTVVGMLFIKDGKAMIGDTIIGDMSNKKEVSSKIRSSIARALLTK